jgi:hypothetical protein
MQVGGQSGINLLLRYGPAQRCSRVADVHQQSLLMADEIFTPGSARVAGASDRGGDCLA